MRYTRHTALTLLGLALTIGPAFAGPVQVDLQAIGTLPDGKLGIPDVDLDDAFDFGYGLRGGLMFGLNDYVYLGGNAGWHRSAAGELFDEIDADLTSIPVHGLFQLRIQNVIGLYAQAGAGFTHQKFDGDEFLDLEGSQTSFSWLVGGGLSFGLPGPVALTVGVDYSGIEPGEGDLWSDDASPRFWLFSAGIRIHTD